MTNKTAQDAQSLQFRTENYQEFVLWIGTLEKETENTVKNKSSRLKHIIKKYVVKFFTDHTILVSYIYNIFLITTNIILDLKKKKLPQIKKNLKLKYKEKLLSF